MLAIAFDTLKLARKLENAGMHAKQAQEVSAALSEMLAEWQSANNAATQDDWRDLKGGVLREVQKLTTTISDTKCDFRKWILIIVCTPLYVILIALFALMHSVGII